MNCDRMIVRCFLLFSLLLTATDMTRAAEPKVELLWPHGVPGAKGDQPNDKPTLSIFLPEAQQAVGTAVVICPGGGYGGTAVDHEGRQIAQWLNSFGVTGIMLDYRHRGRGYGHPAPLQDAQQAIRTIRPEPASGRLPRIVSASWVSRPGATWRHLPARTSTRETAARAT